VDTSDLDKYEQQTIALRLNEREAKALLNILVECDLSDKERCRFAKDEDRILICDRLAHEMDAFKWRRHTD
jgi:hypothetical protein